MLIYSSRIVPSILNSNNTSFINNQPYLDTRMFKELICSVVEKVKELKMKGQIYSTKYIYIFKSVALSFDRFKFKW